jgi:hypothetical protein
MTAVDSTCNWAEKEKAEDAAKSLLARNEEAAKENTVRSSRAWQYTSLFEGLVLSLPSTSDRQQRPQQAPITDTPIIRNRVRSIVQTWISKVTAGDSPLPQFMTTDAEWDTRRRAVAWDRAVEAEIDQPQGAFADHHELWRHAATIATVVGSVAVYFGLGEDGGPCAEISDTLTMGVDTAGPHGKPYSIVWARDLSLREARALFPDAPEGALEGALETSDGSTNDRATSLSELALYGRFAKRTFVRVVCGWALGMGDEPGRYMAVLRDGTILADEQYTRPELPFVFYHFERELYGQWGIPLVQTVYQAALRENEMLNDVHQAERNTPQVIVFGHPSQIEPGSLDEAKGVHLVQLTDEGKLNPPTFVAPPKFNRQSLELVQLEASEQHNISGLSEAHTSARKSAGTTSGRHESLVASLFTERFADHERRLIRARTVSTARQLVWRLQDAIDGGYEYSRSWKGKRKIAAEDLDFELDFEVQIKPVSEDKSSPAARMKQLEEYFQAGLITGGELVAGQEHLDSISVSKLATQQEQWIEESIEAWLYDDPVVYQAPVKWLDLEAGVAQVANAYLKARSEGAPPERLEYFEQFMAECQIYIDQKKLQETAMQSPSAVGPAGLSAAFPGAMPAGPPPPQPAGLPGAPAPPL